MLKYVACALGTLLAFAAHMPSETKIRLITGNPFIAWNVGKRAVFPAPLPTGAGMEIHWTLNCKNISKWLFIIFINDKIKST